MPDHKKLTRSSIPVPLTVMLAVLAMAATLTIFGCLPAAKQTATPAPVVNTDAPDAETAYWRNEYNKNRPVPPRDYQVQAKPPRDNQFGEFREEMHQGLDAQPTLPELPGDTHIMPAVGGPAGYPAPAVTYPALDSRRRPIVAAYPVNEPAAAGAAARAAASSPRPAGIQTDSHFYPIEQLVYGGDYPDIDKPELYRLMPKDVVSVTVRDHPEFSGRLEIQPDGTLRIPNTPDPIRIRGMTVEEAAEEIRRNLAVYIRGECVVRVQANRARGGYYFVFGDVLQPGRFPMGMEPIKLSDAVLAANWEVNPSRLDADGDELGPAFPAASPRGRFVAPRSADMARVMLITPHRSQPVRTVHDIRTAMLGVTADDPAVRPGQIIVVPSLDPERNGALGLDMPAAAVPPAKMPGAGFSGASSPARLPEVTPPGSPYARQDPVPYPAVEANLAEAFERQSNTEPPRMLSGDAYCETVDGEIMETTPAERVVSSTVYESAPAGSGAPVGRRLGRKMPQKRQFSTRDDDVDGWKKGF